MSGVVGMISLLDEPVIGKIKNDEEMQWAYDIIASIILTSIQIFKFIGLCCCGKYVSFGVNFIWIGIELIIVLILGISEWKVSSAITAPMVSLSFSFIVISSQLTWKHLDLIAHHLTEKEFHAR